MWPSLISGSISNGLAWEENDHFVLFLELIRENIFDSHQGYVCVEHFVFPLFL